LILGNILGCVVTIFGFTNGKLGWKSPLLSFHFFQKKGPLKIGGRYFFLLGIRRAKLTPLFGKLYLKRAFQPL